MPDYYQIFKYTSSEFLPRLTDLVRTRAYFAAAYAGYSDKKCKISFNQQPIPVKNVQELASIIFPNDVRLAANITPSGNNTTYNYAWELVVVIRPTSGALDNMTIVNGIMVRGGKHIKYVTNKLIEGVKLEICKHLKDKNAKFVPSQLTNNIFIMLNSKIPNPSWTGQRKDILEIDIRKLSHYVVPQGIIKELTENVKEFLIDNIIKKETKAVKHTDYEKYTPAKKAGTDQSHKCVLIMAEGDSALTQVVVGISNNKHLDKRYYGMISLGGVPINARKNCSKYVRPDKSIRYAKNAKLSKNVLMNVLMEVIGLRHDFTYSTPKELASLRYGALVACVDQDDDGKNILGLVANNINYFWQGRLY
jgi:DNA topoisomerase-2